MRSAFSNHSSENCPQNLWVTSRGGSGTAKRLAAFVAASALSVHAVDVVDAAEVTGRGAAIRLHSAKRLILSARGYEDRESGNTHCAAVTRRDSGTEGEQPDSKLLVGTQVERRHGCSERQRHHNNYCDDIFGKNNKGQQHIDRRIAPAAASTDPKLMQRRHASRCANVSIVLTLPVSVMSRLWSKRLCVSTGSISAISSKLSCHQRSLDAESEST